MSKFSNFSLNCAELFFIFVKIKNRIKLEKKLFLRIQVVFWVWMCWFKKQQCKKNIFAFNIEREPIINKETYLSNVEIYADLRGGRRCFGISQGVGLPEIHLVMMMTWMCYMMISIWDHPGAIRCYFRN